MTNEISKLLHEKQYAQIKCKLSVCNVADVAALLEALPIAELLTAFRLLPKDTAASVFSYLSLDVQQALIGVLGDEEAIAVIEGLYADDAADLLEELPAGVVKRLLTGISPHIRSRVNHLLGYPESSAGSFMTVELMDLRATDTVAQAIERLHRVEGEAEHLDVCYVLDERRKLIGVLPLRKLLFASADTNVGVLMDPNVISAQTEEDRETVARLLQRYDFNALPIVDREDRLVGVVTIDDVVDIIEREATEDIEIMAAITPTERPYLRTGVLATFSKRIPWLLLLMVSATFTSTIISSFERLLATQVALTAFIPMLMDTGGNAGGQASVTVIRGLSLGEIGFADTIRVVWKELRVALLCGAALGGVGFLKLLLWDVVGWRIAAVVSLTMLVSVVVAKLIGCTMPVLAKRIGLDPAVMASPFITTLVDAIALLLYFIAASMLLGL